MAIEMGFTLSQIIQLIRKKSLYLLHQYFLSLVDKMYCLRAIFQVEILHIDYLCTILKSE